MRFLNRIFYLLFSAYLTLAPFLAYGSQNQLSSPTTGTVSGLQITDNYNAALDSLNTCNSGASAPANQLTNVPSLGNCWLNTSTGAMAFWDGTDWLVVGYIDASNHVFTPILGGNAATTVASATTTNLCGSSGASPIGAFLTISGTTTITGFGTNCAIGQIKVLKFSGILSITYNSGSMILPTAASITTAVGDVAVAISLGSGNWQIAIYQTASGAALSSSLNFTGALFVNGAISPSSLSSSQNNYNPSGLSTANVIRQASSAAVNITGLNAPATNGQDVVIENINTAGTFNITLTANDANSTAANRFRFPHPVGLQPGQSIEVVYDATSAGWRLKQKVYASPYQGGFKNLRVFNVADALGDNAPSTPNTQMVIAADEVVAEDGNGNSVRLAALNCTVSINTSGAGGLDTGSVATGNWYYLYVIFNPTTNATSCMGSLSTTGGTLPSGYSFWARVGANYYLTANTVTGFQRVVQYGRYAYYVVKSSTPTAYLPVISSTSNEGSISVPTWIAKSVTPVVPATASQIIVQLMGAGAAVALVAPSNGYGAYNAAGAAALPYEVFAPNGEEVINRINLQLESSNIYTANQTSGAFQLTAVGWEDNL